MKIDAALVVENIDLPIDEGIKKVGFFIAQYFSKNEVPVFTKTRNNSLLKNYSLPANKFLFSINFIRKLRKFKAQNIIYLPYSSSTLFSFIRLFILKIISQTKNSILISVQKRKHSLIEKKIIKILHPDLIITFSSKEQEYYKVLGIKAMVVTSGVEIDKYTPVDNKIKIKLKKKYNIATDENVILHVGHLNKNRNVEIFNKICKMGFKVIIVASTSTVIDNEIYTELKRSGCTIFTSFLKDVHELYQLSDLYIFPVNKSSSAIEFPLSILEAMSCNIAVFTTKFGGITEFFKESSSFKYFNSTEDLLALIKNFYPAKDCDNRTRMEQAFNWDSSFKKIEHALQELSK